MAPRKGEEKGFIFNTKTTVEDCADYRLNY